MSAAMQPLLPGSTLGVLGGGQLGRMFVHQAQAIGYFKKSLAFFSTFKYKCGRLENRALDSAL